MIATVANGVSEESSVSLSQEHIAPLFAELRVEDFRKGKSYLRNLVIGHGREVLPYKLRYM